MKLKTFVPALVLLLLAGACSRSLSTQEYFTEVGDINKHVKDAENAASDDLSQVLTNPTQDPEQAVTAFEEYLTTLLEAANQALKDLDDLTPPSDVQEQHDAFLQAQTALVAGLQKVLDDVEGASASEIQSIMSAHTQEMTTLSEDADKACRDLQAAADEAGVKVDLCDSEAQDKAAQSAARNGVAAAKTLFVDADSYANVNAESLGQLEQSLAFVDSPLASPDPNTVSVWTDGDMVYAEAVLSQTGTCFWMKDDATSGTTYGTGTADTCTGEDASAASDPGW